MATRSRKVAKKASKDEIQLIILG
jgi:hypothetical protein